jgi:hypothetical protein
MGIALLAIADFWMPLQSLASRLIACAPRSPPGPTRSVTKLAGLRYVAVRPACTTRSRHACADGNGATAPARPLRVVRVIDGKSRRTATAVVISGRMADVCAELDRLAALEAAETMVTSPTFGLH